MVAAPLMNTSRPSKSRSPQDETTDAATEDVAANAVPAEVHQIVTSALAASDLYFTAARQRAEAGSARHAANMLSQTAVDTSASAVQGAHSMTTTIRHVLSEAERITMLRTGELAVATAEHENLQAAAQQIDQAAAARRNPVLAIEDAFPAIVDDGTIPAATTAQAFHALLTM